MRFLFIYHAQPQAIVCLLISYTYFTDTYSSNERPSTQNQHILPKQNEPKGDLLVAIRDTTTIKIVYRQLNLNLISRQDLDVVHTHLSGDMGQYLVSIFELYPKHCVRKCLENRTL